jgi:carboxymethylenebutenolidase
MTAAPAGELTADWLTLTTADGPMRLYRVRPRKEQAVTPPAAVIVLQEAFGVNDHIQDVARRLAEEGYLAVAPDLFHRSGGQTVDYADRETAMGLIAQLGPEPIIADVSAVLTHLAGDDRVPADRTAIVGFCFGGRAAFTAATSLPVAATVVFYGPGIARGPHAVLDRVGKVTGHVLMLVGDADPTIPADDLAAINSAAERAGIDLRMVVFAGAGHAFHCDARPNVYVADAARQAWRNTTTFLADHLRTDSREPS